MKIVQAVCLVILGFGIGWYAHTSKHKLVVQRMGLAFDEITGQSCYTSLPTDSSLHSCQELISGIPSIPSCSWDVEIKEPLPCVKSKAQVDAFTKSWCKDPQNQDICEQPVPVGTKSK